MPKHMLARYGACHLRPLIPAIEKELRKRFARVLKKED